MNVLECVRGLGSGCMCYYKIQNWDDPVTMRSNMVITLQPFLEKTRNSCFFDFTQNTHSQPELWHYVYTPRKGCICLQPTCKCCTPGKCNCIKERWNFS